MRWLIGSSVAAVVATLAVVIAASCARPAPPPRIFPPPPADHVRVAQAEAARGVGVRDLIELAGVADPEVSRRAVRGLGRVGGPQAIAGLVNGGGPLSVERAEALALAEAGDQRQALVDLTKTATDTAQRRAALWALGRLATAAEVRTIAVGLDDPDPTVRTAAGIALGLVGRRDLELDDAARARLGELVADPEPAVRYGVAYALAREHGGNGAELLRRLAGDTDPEIRALVIMGCARRGIADVELYRAALADEDWRVRVEAVRAASSADASPELRRLLADWLVEQVEQGRIVGPAIHPVLTGVTRLADFADSDVVLQALDRIHAALGPETDLARGALHCMAAFGRVRAGAPRADLIECGGAKSGWPLYLRRRLVADVLKEGTSGQPEELVALLDSLAADADPRVRAAGIAAGLVSEADEVRELAQRLTLDVLQNETSSVVVGTVVEVIGAEGMKLSPQLEAALLARARREQQGDAELRLTLIEALRVGDVTGSRSVLEAALTDRNVSVRKGARDALRFLFPEEEHPAQNLAPSIEPPVEIAEVLNREIQWHLSTSRGEVVIELWPEVAPWSVATLVTLAERGSYDQTPWHRVVPGFVAQGGDPTGSGWGGPGFAVPNEASSSPFVRGAVGIADAGKDTGGSQFFIMHARAPHLEGRYTLVGRVIRGLEVVDATIVGDRIERSWISYP